MAEKLTQEILKKKIYYNEKTGVISRVNRRNENETRGIGRIKNGFRLVKISGKEYPAHRLAWLYVYGEYPKQNLIHINGDKLDIRIANLKEWEKFDGATSKVCTVCNTEKPLEEFFIDHRGKYGRTSWCKDCLNGNSKKWQKENKERSNENIRKWQIKHREICIARKRNARASNPDKYRQKDKEYREKNIEKVGESRRKYMANLLKTPRGRLNHLISLGIRQRLKKDSKAGRHWETLVDFTLDELKQHIEKQFTDGMNWERYIKGEIHIDHIIPLSVHNFETPEDVDFKKAWALDNLRPMWAQENIIKSNKLDKPFQPSLLMGVA